MFSFRRVPCLAAFGLGIGLVAPAVRAEDPPLFLTTWGHFGTAAGEFQNCADVAAGVSGIIYVADYGNMRIQRFTAAGTFIDAWPTQPIDQAVVRPRSIAVDQDENVFVVDQASGHVQKYTATGTLVTTWGGVGTADGQFRSPVGIAVAASGHVFVANGISNDVRIQEFTNAGVHLRTIVPQASLLGGIALDGAGNIFISHVFHYHVTKLDPNGNVLQDWGAQGSADGLFNAPGDLFCDPVGNVYVVEQVFPPFQPSNHRVQKFTNNGDFLSAWGGLGSSPGQFNDPHGVTVDLAGNIYVADTSNHRIQKFGDATVPIAITAFEVTRSRTGVEIHWELASRLDAECDMWRADGLEGPFERLGVVPQRSGERGYTGVDATARPEAEYWYKLGVRQSSEWFFSAVVHVARTSSSGTRLAAGPNPARGNLHVELSIPQDGLARLDVFDVSGARVCALVDRHVRAGSLTLSWTGRDDRGALLPAGRYFIRLSANGQVQSRPIVLLR